MPIRIGWGEARCYLKEKWGREPTEQEIMDYQDYMSQSPRSKAARHVP